MAIQNCLYVMGLLCTEWNLMAQQQERLNQCTDFLKGSR
jgi:hypothetical protein